MLVCWSCVCFICFKMQLKALGNVWLRIIFTAELTWTFSLIWVSSIQTFYLKEASSTSHSSLWYLVCLLCEESDQQWDFASFLWHCWGYTLNVLFGLCATVKESCWGAIEGPASIFSGTGHMTYEEGLRELGFSYAKGDQGNLEAV